MGKIIYLLTYDLQLYTKPEIWDKEYKKYNKDTGYFEELDKKPNGLDTNAIECDIVIVTEIMKNIIHADYGVLLDSEKMKWYINFQKEVKNRPALLENDELLFNYLILKATLAGMSENLAKTIYAHYMNKKLNDASNLISPSQIIDVQEKIIQTKVYWIPDISEELKKECLLIDDIIRSRSTSSDYSFEMFEARYLRLCNEGYIRRILKYNKDANNLFSRGLSFEEQKDLSLIHI